MTMIKFNKTVLPTIPADVLQGALGHIQAAQQALLPYLADLGAADRRALPQMGDKAVGWVSNTLSFMQANPDLQPGYVNMVDFSNDLNSVGVFRSLIQPVQLLADRLNDSYQVCSNAAFNSSLACYQAVKTGARLNLPMAASIASELSATYPRRARVGRTKAGGGNGAGPGAPVDGGHGSDAPPAAMGADAA